jgi:hypothetical protein
VIWWHVLVSAAKAAQPHVVAPPPPPLPAPVHWTTYVQTFAAIAAAIGTFVYVVFTYHIMKWAIGQGRSAAKMSDLAMAQELDRRFAVFKRASDFTSQLSLFSRGLHSASRANDRPEMRLELKRLREFLPEAEDILQLDLPSWLRMTLDGLYVHAYRLVHDSIAMESERVTEFRDEATYRAFVAKLSRHAEDLMGRAEETRDRIEARSAEMRSVRSQLSV